MDQPDAMAQQVPVKRPALDAANTLSSHLRFQFDTVNRLFSQARYRAMGHVSKLTPQAPVTLTKENFRVEDLVKIMLTSGRMLPGGRGQFGQLKNRENKFPTNGSTGQPPSAEPARLITLSQ